MDEQTREDTIIETIKNTTKKLGYDYEELSEKDKEYLNVIEEAITETFELEEQARKMLSRNTVSVKGVSKKTDIARQTLYNNPMLKEYINFRSTTFIKSDASRRESMKDAEIQTLKEEVEVLHKRDVELEETKRQVKELKRMLEEKQARINSLVATTLHRMN